MSNSPPRIDEIRAAWVESERQLYPLAVTNSLRYQQIITVVRSLADNMHEITSLEQLVASWPQAQEMLEATLSSGAVTGNLPREQLAGAAFALREKEIREQNNRQALKERIAAAELSGDEWVLLETSGSIDSGLLNPYRSTEMHLVTGFSVMSMVQPDPSNGEPMFVISVIKLDPSSGELLDNSPGIEDWLEFASQDDFDRHRDIVRDRIKQVHAADNATGNSK